MQQWTSKIIEALRRPWFKDQTGQGLAEYALILALIAIIAIVSSALHGLTGQRQAQRHR